MTNLFNNYENNTAIPDNRYKFLPLKPEYKDVIVKGAKAHHCFKIPYAIDQIQDVIVIIIYMILAIVSLFILFKENYYVILNDGFVHHRWVKDLKIRFNEILYIDEEYTKKNKTILFYTDKGSSFFMILDDEDKLYNLIKEKSKNLMSKDEYHKKFPKISL